MRRGIPLILSLVALAVAAAAPAAGAARRPDARLTGDYLVTGTVRAQGVRGERSGQVVRRRWVFTPACPRGACRTVRLRRPRSDGGVDTLVLHRIAAGTYRARGRFFFPVRCERRVVRRGGEAPFAVTVRITRIATVQRSRFATGIAATYDNAARINRTRCFGDLGHDSARYGGHRAGGAPSAPRPAFSATPDPSAADTVDFRDASAPGRAGAPIVARRWDFGDPSSGAGDRSTAAAPAHTFSAAGTYVVTLTVTDADGLTSRTAQRIAG